MNITINSQQLAAELRLHCKIVPTKPTLQILSHVLLKADAATGLMEGDGDLHLQSSDLEVGMASKAVATINEPGMVAVPVNKLLALVEQFPDADVHIAQEDARVLIKCGTFKTYLQTLTADEFTQLPAVEGAPGTLTAEALQGLIARTRHAIITGGSKYVLQGAFLTLTGKMGAMVATDGKRLAMATCAREGADVSVNVPAKALDILSVQHAQGPVDFSVGSRHLFFRVGGRLIVSRMLEGEFPKYNAIIPRDNELKIAIDRIALAAALRRINLVASDTRAVYLEFSTNSLKLASSSLDIGQADETMAVHYEGTPLKVCINGDYVLDFLNVASSPSITLALKNETSAAMLMDGTDFIVVIMLMRTK